MATATALTALSLAACGGGETEEDRVASAVEKLQDALRAGDVSAVCAAMTERPARQVGSVGHGRRPTTCFRDLRELLQGMARTEAFYDDRVSLQRVERPTVSRVELDRTGETATVALALREGDSFTVRMRRQRGDWKLDELFGADGPTPRALR